MALNVTPEQLRAKLLEQQNKNKRDETSTPRKQTGDNASFPFWDTAIGKTTALRFLPDADEDNIDFWRERQVIKLPFQGVVGGEYPTTKEVEVTVPCVDMFGMSCPIIAATRPLWKGSEDEIALARRYYKKRSFIFQGFVVKTDIVEENPPENPIRRFVLNKSIYDIIFESAMNPEFEHLPVDFIGGRDFNIKKTQRGQHANYSTSAWSFSTRSLNETEQAAIDKYGLYTLKDYLGRVPDADELAAIKAMFEASMAGEPFDMASFGNYYRPYTSRQYNNDSSGGDSEASYTPQTQNTPSVSNTNSVNTPSTSSSDAAMALVARVRDRMKNGGN